MGQCTSAQADSPATVKLVMPDGSLREFSWSVRPAYILGKEEQQTYFICDSDTLEIDRAVAAVPADRELRIGQIYFALPRTMLDRPLKAEEMAALAIRASAALAKSGNGGRKGRKGTVTPLVFEMEEEEEGSKEVVKKKVEKRKGSGKGRKFVPELSAIAE